MDRETAGISRRFATITLSNLYYSPASVKNFFTGETAEEETTEGDTTVTADDTTIPSEDSGASEGEDEGGGWKMTGGCSMNVINPVFVPQHRSS